MQLLSALDQMVGLLWISLLVAGVLVACGIAVYATNLLAARLRQGEPFWRSFRSRLVHMYEAVAGRRA